MNNQVATAHRGIWPMHGYDLSQLPYWDLF